MASIKTSAIVLKTSPFSEADKLVDLLTPEHGKIRAIAKGALKVTSKFGARLLPLAYDEISLSQGRNLDILTECQSINLFPTLRDDMVKMGLGLRIADFLQQTLPIGYRNPALFELFGDFLHGLSQAPDPETSEVLAMAFHFKFLEREGHSPQLKRCVICHREVKSPPQKIAFEVSQGGIICRSCRRTHSNVRILPYSCLQLLNLWKDKSLLELAGSRPTGAFTKLLPLLQEYTERAIR